MFKKTLTFAALAIAMTGLVGCTQAMKDYGEAIGSSSIMSGSGHVAGQWVSPDGFSRPAD